jgi:hypothetical protein
LSSPDLDRDRHPGHADLNPADPNRYQFQANEKAGKVNFFPDNFNMLSKTQKNYDTFDTDEKGKTL